MNLEECFIWKEFPKIKNNQNDKEKNTLLGRKINSKCKDLYIINKKPKLNFKNNINLFSLLIFTHIIFLRNLSTCSEIEIVIEGQGIQKIIYPDFKNKPNKIYINDEEQNEIYTSYNFVDSINKIKMEWYSNLKSCNSIFKDLTNIKTIDLSNFDTSEVTDMGNMFRGCSSLEYINFGIHDTSSLILMSFMFSGCKNLTSVNLDNFNTSKVTEMNRLFEDCQKLTSLNLSHFNTKSAKITSHMFTGCEALASLDISNFDTSKVTSMVEMFKNCKELISLDLSNFNTINVTTMNSMFLGCEKLTNLNLANFETSNVENMNAMFQNCKNLTSLDLSSFDTSKVKNMRNMFCGCEALTSMNLENFKTSNLININSMFKDCTSLKSLNLNNFQISSNIDMTNIFYNCKALIALEFENLKLTDIDIIETFAMGLNPNLMVCLDFLPPKQDITYNCSEICNNDIYGYEYNNSCYKTCPKKTNVLPDNTHLCEYLNCENKGKYYNFEQNQCIENIPNGYFLNDSILYTIDKCHNNCKTCEEKGDINNNKCTSCKEDLYFNFGNCTESFDFISSTISNTNTISKCPNNKCKECSLESLEKNLCISCNIENKFFPKFEEFEETYDRSLLDCYNETPFGYYLDKDVYKIDKSCDNFEKYNLNNDKTFFLENVELSSYNCPHYYYCDELNNYYCINDNICPENYKNLIINKKKCVNQCLKDSYYKFEYKNHCYNSCPNGTISSPNNAYLCKENNNKYKCSPSDFFNRKCVLNNTNNNSDSNINDNNISKDEMLKDIKNEIMNGGMDDLISNVVINEKQDLLIKEENTLFQITSSENQNNNKYINISTIILGECENILKQIYKIDDNQTLIILKIDYFMPGSLVPKIGYEIYHPTNKSKLDLTHCKNENINLNIPALINEDILFKYDPNDEYYINECIPYTTDSGTDILINDRQNEFNINNMSLCENNCTYNGYHIDSKNAKCECGIKNKDLIISELMNQTDALSYNFSGKETSSNVITMKCFQTLFSKNGLIKNIGNYILLFNIVFNFICGILFYKIGYPLLENDISIIKKEKEKEKYNKTKGSLDVSEKIKKKTIVKKYTNKKKKNKKLKANPKKKKLKKGINNRNSNSIIILKKKNNESYSIDDKIMINANENYSLKYNDYELNTMLYKEAKIYDRRVFINYYFSLIKIKNYILFSFCPIRDYNSKIIKVSLFFIFFSIYYFINALFFDEKTIHKIYEDEGAYNFIYLVRYIFYSFAISQIFNTIIKYIFLSERNIVEIKKEQTMEKANDVIDKVKKRIIIKYICYFGLSSIFLIFFWYYLSSFGAVYQNTQVYLIKNTLISFAISLIYPFIINVIPSILRIKALNGLNNEFMFKISIYFQYI